MTTELSDRTLQGFYDNDSGALFEDMLFRRCAFEGCRISITEDPALRCTVRNVRLENCSVRGCAIEAAIIEDCVVDGLKTYNGLQCWAAVFKHVVLRGRIGKVMISNVVQCGIAPPEAQRAFDEANAAYYAQVDWALDLSRAEFLECDIRGLLSKFIIRDPETQVVVKRCRAIEGNWRYLPLENMRWSVSLEFLAEGRKGPDAVLVAPKRHPRFRELLAGLELLRKEGIAEPD